MRFKQKTPGFISTLGLYAAQYFDGWGVKRVVPGLVATRLMHRNLQATNVVR